MKESVVEYLVKPVKKERLIELATTAANRRTICSGAKPKAISVK
jgi:response regulator of citrate/malate metabolism